MYLEIYIHIYKQLMIKEAVDMKESMVLEEENGRGKNNYGIIWKR